MYLFAVYIKSFDRFEQQLNSIRDYTNLTQLKTTLT